MEKEAAPKRKGFKSNTSVEKRGTQNAWGSNQRPLMKKEATPKCKGLKSKTSDEKRGNPKTQGSQIKELR
jgi:hypothetical protein